MTVSKSTACRLTEAAGKTQVALQEKAVEVMEAGRLPVLEEVPKKLAVGVDGAMIPLVGGQWQEVRTLVIGDVSIRWNHKGERVIVTENLSYFSRLMESQSFQRAALVETEQRGLYQAEQVAVLGDGAEWVQGFADYHRPDARRILDFPHAAERFTTVKETCTQAGIELGEGWAEEQRQQLKEQGGTVVLATLRALQEQYSEVALAEPINYLGKREAMLQYPHFTEEGWPIGSGMVESANKLVVEARLKGAGMHWHPQNVNPMLALRNAVCNNRWEATWPTIAIQQRQPQKAAADPQPSSPPEPNRVLEYYREMQKVHRDWEAEQRAAEAQRAQSKQRWKPAPNHPWRRYANKC